MVGDASTWIPPRPFFVPTESAMRTLVTTRPSILMPSSTFSVARRSWTVVPVTGSGSPAERRRTRERRSLEIRGR